MGKYGRRFYRVLWRNNKNIGYWQQVSDWTVKLCQYFHTIVTTNINIDIKRLLNKDVYDKQNLNIFM